MSATGRRFGAELRRVLIYVSRYDNLVTVPGADLVFPPSSLTLGILRSYTFYSVRLTHTSLAIASSPRHATTEAGRVA